MALPSGFVPLREVLSAKEDSCFLGAITRLQAPVQSKPDGDHVLHFTIKDRFPGDEKDSVACILKQKYPQWLPKGSPGDIAILRNMKVEILGAQNTKTLVNEPELESQALFFPSKLIPDPGGDPTLTLAFPVKGNRPTSLVEQTAVISMKAAAAPLLEELKDPKNMFFARLGPNSRKPQQTKKMSLISDMTFNQFYHLVGEVVKTYWGTTDSVDLYVTDYTTNIDLYLYEESSTFDPSDGYGSTKKRWAGPFGQKTIQIRCYEPHAQAARKLKEGDFVYLQNIRTKMSRMNKLEGAIHQDDRYPEKVGVMACTNPGQVKALKERKAEYEKKSGAALTNHDDLASIPKNLSAKASAKKKLNRNQRRRLAREEEQKKLEEQANAVDKPAKGLNKNSKVFLHPIRTYTYSYSPRWKYRRRLVDGR